MHGHDTASLRALFIQELEKQAQAASIGLLDFEKGDANGLSTFKTAIHSAKGAARIVQAASVEKLCHDLEEVAQIIEKNQPLALEILLHGVDVLQRFAHIESDEDKDLAQDIEKIGKQIELYVSDTNKKTSTVSNIEEFAHHFALRDAYLSIETTHARALLSLTYELLRESERLERFIDQEYTSEGICFLQTHIIHCNMLCNLAQKLQMVPFSKISRHLARFLREASTRAGKLVRLVVLQEDALIDKEILDQITLVLLQLIQNAVDHGIETSQGRVLHKKNPDAVVIIDTKIQDNRLLLSVTDDGSGIDFTALKERAAMISDKDHTLPELLFANRISTKQELSFTSGRGIGLKQVRQAIEQIGGSIVVDTQKNIGTTIQLNLPVSLSIVSIVLLQVGKELYGCLSVVVDHVDIVPKDYLIQRDGVFYIVVDQVEFRVVNMRSILGYSPVETLPSSQSLCFVHYRGENIAFVVDQFLGAEEVIVQENWPLLGKRKYIEGCALSKTTEPVLLLCLEDFMLL